MKSTNRSSGIIKIADLPFYTEGPVTDSDGNIFFTNLTGGSIFKINDRNQISEWASSLCPNGQILLPGGDHLVCDSRMSAVRRFSRDGNFLKNEIIYSILYSDYLLKKLWRRNTGGDQSNK
jgi:gluconolactonase